MHAPPSGRARLRFGRYDYAAFLFFAAYAASSLERQRAKVAALAAKL